MENSKNIISKIKSNPFLYLIGPMFFIVFTALIVMAFIHDSREAKRLESTREAHIENVLSKLFEGCAYEYVLLAGDIEYETSLHSLENSVNRFGQASFYVHDVEANRGEIVVVMERKDCR